MPNLVQFWYSGNFSSSRTPRYRPGCFDGMGKEREAMAAKATDPPPDPMYLDLSQHSKLEHGAIDGHDQFGTDVWEHLHLRLPPHAYTTAKEDECSHKEATAGRGLTLHIDCTPELQAELKEAGVTCLNPPPATGLWDRKTDAGGKVFERWPGASLIEKRREKWEAAQESGMN